MVRLSALPSPEYLKMSRLNSLTSLHIRARTAQHFSRIFQKTTKHLWRADAKKTKRLLVTSYLLHYCCHGKVCFVDFVYLPPMSTQCVLTYFACPCLDDLILACCQASAACSLHVHQEIYMRLAIVTFALVTTLTLDLQAGAAAGLLSVLCPLPCMIIQDRRKSWICTTSTKEIRGSHSSSRAPPSASPAMTCST